MTWLLLLLLVLVARFLGISPAQSGCLVEQVNADVTLVVLARYILMAALHYIGALDFCEPSHHRLMRQPTIQSVIFPLILVVAVTWDVGAHGEKLRYVIVLVVIIIEIRRC